MAATSGKHIKRLFNANPPRLDDPLLDHLFVDREDELRFARELLTAEGDFDPQVYAVYGDSRTGKSHMTLRILRAVQRDFEIVSINANSAGSARSALRQVFFAVRDRLAAIDTPGAADWLRWAQDLALLIDDQVEQVEVTVTEAFKTQLQARLGFKGSHIQETGERSGSEAVKLTVRRPDDAVLARHVSTLALGLLDCTRRPLLLNIDDLDLLNHPGDTRGVAEAEALLTHLAEVAAAPRIVIVASVRNRFFTSRDKHLKPFVQVRAFDDPRLAEVLDKQIRVLHADERIFDVLCRNRLMRLARGRVGIFIDQCGRLWRYARMNAVDLPIGEATFRAYLAEHVRDLSRNPETARAMRAIVEAVSGEAPTRELDLPGVDPEDSPFAYTVVRPTAFALPDRVEVVPEAVEAIRAVFGEGAA